MKLVIAIVQDEDAHNLLQALSQEGFRATKMATTGGFLRAGNTTLFVGVSEERVNKVIKIIEEKCRSRKQVATSPSPLTESTATYVPYPIEVNVGGATLFVVDVERFEQI